MQCRQCGGYVPDTSGGVLITMGGVICNACLAVMMNRKQADTTPMQKQLIKWLGDCTNNTKAKK